MSGARYVVLRCNGPDCDAETHHPFSDGLTITRLRRIRHADGWHARPGGRDICPTCWKAGHR